ncbi:hypothetical protein E2C01_082388 [Portunus trituberculatus]|uniref:Uncharacterized protein n=1 Tax=Portunus trituberculatus TaxID=210409 RepID=A0A5B7IYC6_PORTR|nr:hypothetical protein [Portunus trituberculatus]
MAEHLVKSIPSVLCEQRVDRLVQHESEGHGTAPSPRHTSLQREEGFCNAPDSKTHEKNNNTNER